MKKQIYFIFLAVLLIGLVSSGGEGEILEDKAVLNQCYKLQQTCSSCTYSTISAVVSPNGTVYAVEQAMIQAGTFYSYNFCNVTELGTYAVNGHFDVSGVDQVFNYYFVSNTSGDNFGIEQAIMLLGMFALIALFFGMGLTFKEEKWKVKSFFFMCSMLIGIILLNSIRIIIGTSTNLASMGNTALILGIVILSVMFLYTLIMYTIEMFNYFKDKKEMKWKITSQ